MSEYIKVVLVTGGSSGLGKAICTRLAAIGHTVYGTSRKEYGANDSKGFTMVQMDVTNEESVKTCMQGIVTREGRIDVLINNAGLGIQGPAEDLSVEEAQQLLDTNLLGPHRACRTAIPYMRKQGRGLIINISSVAANFGLPYRSFYSASKAALDRYSEALGTEVERFGITVVTIQPGEFDTNIKNSRIEAKTVSEANRPGYERAMEILGGSMHYSRDPDDLARLVARILASPKPKLTYVMAKGMQKLSVQLRKVLPGRMFMRMLRKHYE